MAKRKRDEGNGVPEWVVTYGDLMSLLLTFFILLAAFSELKQEREYLDVVRSIKEAFGYVGDDGRMPMDDDTQSMLMATREHRGRRRDDEPAAVAKNTPNVSGRSDTVSHINEGIKRIIGGNATFAPASTELSEDAKLVLRQAAEEIRGLNYLVYIKGHAYGPEDRTGGDDLVDLSYRRAREAIRFLVEEGGVDPQILRAYPAGDMEPASGGEFPGAVGAQSRRVQVIQTEILIDELVDDPYGTGRPSDGR